MEKIEYILCSAIIYKGVIVSGLRHSDCILNVAQLLGNEVNRIELGRSKQGFLTSFGRFVDRKEGYLIALNAEQIEKGNDEILNYDILYSEYLY